MFHIFDLKRIKQYVFKAYNKRSMALFQDILPCFGHFAAPLSSCSVPGPHRINPKQYNMSLLHDGVDRKYINRAKYSIMYNFFLQ